MRKSLLTAALGLLALAAGAQTAPTGPTSAKDDFGYDLSIGVEKKLATGLSLELNGNYRTQQDAENHERYAVGAELQYRLYQTQDKNFNLKSSLGFEQIWQKKLAETKVHEDESGTIDGYNQIGNFWRSRQRYSLGLAGTLKASKRWTFQLKETVQWNHYCEADANRNKWRANGDYVAGVDDIHDYLYLKEADVDLKNNRARLVLRNKLTISYDVKGLPFEPFVSADYGCGLNYTADKWKLSAGSDFNIDKQNTLSLYYRYQTENDEDEPDGHLVGLAYKFSF
jgi:opacity protein-like surface antigen